MAKTADYTKRAVDNYRNKFDMYQLRIPKDSGLKERMKEAYGKDMNNIILRLIEDDLERKANNSASNAENTPNQPYTEPSKAKNTTEAVEDSTQRYIELLEAENRARIGEAEYMRQAQEFENMKRTLAAQMGLDYDEIIRSKQQNAQEAQEPPF